MSVYLDRLNSFTLENIPDLDEVVLGALERFSSERPKQISITKFTRPLVVGSVNAATTGRIVFENTNALFANESTYTHILDREKVDGIVIISASGGKHAVEIAHIARERGIEAVLITNNHGAPAKTYLNPENVHVLPKNREPYTYNTSTYLGMMFASGGEDPQAIRQFIESEVRSCIPDDLATYTAFFLILPPQFDAVQEMCRTKFDELFGPKLVGRVFTIEQAKHAKTVIQDEHECFVSFGVQNSDLGPKENRLSVPLPENVGYAAMIAISYYVIGHIQKQFPPYFKESIVRYTEEASRLFGHTINPIVE